MNHYENNIFTALHWRYFIGTSINFWVAWFLFCLATPLPFSKLPKTFCSDPHPHLHEWWWVGSSLEAIIVTWGIWIRLQSHYFWILIFSTFTKILMMPVLRIFTHGRFQPDLAQAICLIFNLDAPNCLPSDLGASRIIFLPPWPSRIFLDMSDIFLEIF